ncbi:YolD-like family protein [Neobacillus sp. 179-C4.2 HS]|uniref:YolD-like family protein n=1 Tax=Neobacillus driksii TaxID=3035913 RepID=A0ABV4YRV9_9BACI|nr:YolD-like family protein [Neobacillus sp. 179.-C4.2 HS]MDP5195030.1 YolD-like family protein [Neobacillus sp. 179.-C4.2 HS]
MTIRDRGKLKWQSASFIPQAFEMTSEMFRDQARTAKPLLDEHQTEEFDLRIAYATEYNHAVKLTVWEDGFTHDITGRVHYVHPITHELRMEREPGEFERVAFDSVVGVKVLN